MMQWTAVLLGGRYRASLPKKAVPNPLLKKAILKKPSAAATRRKEESNMRKFEILIRKAKRQNARRISLAVAAVLKKRAREGADHFSAREKKYASNKIKAEKELTRLAQLAMKQRHLQLKEEQVTTSKVKSFSSREKKAQLRQERIHLEGVADAVFLDYLKKVKTDRDAALRKATCNAISKGSGNAVTSAEEKVHVSGSDQASAPEDESTRRQAARSKHDTKATVKSTAEEKFIAHLEKLRIRRDEQLHRLTKQAIEKMKKEEQRKAEKAAKKETDSPVESSDSPAESSSRNKTLEAATEPEASVPVEVVLEPVAERPATIQRKKQVIKKIAREAATIAPPVEEKSVQEPKRTPTKRRSKVAADAVEAAVRVVEEPAPAEEPKAAPSGRAEKPIDTEKERAAYFDVLRMRVDSKLSTATKVPPPVERGHKAPWTPSDSNTPGLFRL